MRWEVELVRRARSECGLDAACGFPSKNPCDTQEGRALASAHLQLANQDTGGT